ncbi:MAG: hypothetical protein JXR70_14735 [Spirochaetales bacterium]|nr:hypothetical protein [Spirochaetales bacterium]
MNKLVLIFTALLIFLVVACQNNESLLLALSEAEKVVDNSLDNDLSLRNMVSDGSYFYLAAYGTLYKKDVTASSEAEWGTIALPEGTTGLTALGFFGGNLYLGFFRQGADDGLYLSANQGASWTELSQFKGKQVLDLWNQGSELFVSYYDESRSVDKFGLAYYNGGTYSDTALSALANPVLDVVFSGSSYYAITKSAIYGDADPSLFSEKGKPSTEDAFKGLFYSNTYSLFYVSTDAGYVYSSPDLTTWTVSAAQEISSTKVKVSFTHFAEINGNVLVGTSNYGAYQMQIGDVTKMDRPEGLSNGDKLYYAYVLRFYIDAPRDRVYFITSDKGLFSNQYKDSAWGNTWTWE